MKRLLGPHCCARGLRAPNHASRPMSSSSSSQVVRVPGVTRAYVNELVSVARPFGAVKCTFLDGDALLEMDTREDATSFFEEASRGTLKVGPLPVAVVPTEFALLSTVKGVDVSEVADVRQMWRLARLRAIERMKLTDAAPDAVDAEFRDVLREQRAHSKWPGISKTVYSLMELFVKDGQPAAPDFHLALDTLLEVPTLLRTSLWNRLITEAKVNLDTTLLTKLARVLIRSGQPLVAIKSWEIEMRNPRFKNTVRPELLYPMVEDLIGWIAPDRLRLPPWQSAKVVVPRSQQPTEDATPEVENEYVEVALKFCELMQEVNEGPPSSGTLLLLLDLYCASGKTAGAGRLFDHLMDTGLSRDADASHVAVRALLACNMSDSCMQLLSRMESSGTEARRDTLELAIHWMAREGKTEQVLALFESSLEHYAELDVTCLQSLTRAFLYHGSPEEQAHMVRMVLQRDFGKLHAAELLSACAAGGHFREAVRLFQLLVKGGVSVKGGELNTALLASFAAPAKLDPSSFALGCRVAVAAHTTSPEQLDTELVRGLFYASPPSELAFLLTTSQRLGRAELGKGVVAHLLEHAFKTPRTGDWLHMLQGLDKLPEVSLPPDKLVRYCVDFITTVKSTDDLQLGIQGLRRLITTGSCESWVGEPANVTAAVAAMLDGVKRTQAGAVVLGDALDMCAVLLSLPMQLQSFVSAARALQTAEAVAALPTLAGRRACLPSLVVVLEAQDPKTKEPMFSMLKSSHTLYSLLLEQGTFCAAAYLERRLTRTVRRLAALPMLPVLQVEHVQRHEAAALVSALPVLQQLSAELAGGAAEGASAEDKVLLQALMSLHLIQSMITSGGWELMWAQLSAAQKKNLRTVLLSDLFELATDRSFFDLSLMLFSGLERVEAAVGTERGVAPELHVRLLNSFGRPQSALTTELRRTKAALELALAPHRTALGIGEALVDTTPPQALLPPAAALGRTLDAVLESALQRISRGQSAHQTFLWLESALIRLVRVHRHLGNLQALYPLVVQLLHTSVGISKRIGREIMAALADVDASQAMGVSPAQELAAFERLRIMAAEGNATASETGVTLEEMEAALRHSLSNVPTVAPPVKVPLSSSERVVPAASLASVRPPSRHLEALMKSKGKVEKSQEVELPTRVCHKCNQEGHFARNCPTGTPISAPKSASQEVGAVQNKKLIVCHFCKQEGHVKKECPVKKAEKEKMNGVAKNKRLCNNCQEEGHVAKECPSPKLATEAKYLSACHFCNEVGHLKKDCPAKKASLATILCYKCQQKGHFAKDCPNLKPCFLMAYSGVCARGDTCKHTHDPLALQWFEEQLLIREREVTCSDCGEKGHRSGYGYKRCAKPTTSLKEAPAALS